MLSFRTASLVMLAAGLPAVAHAQPRPARPAQPPATPAQPDPPAEEARLEALEERIKDLEDRSKAAEAEADAKAAEVERLLQQARAEREAEAAAIKKRADEERRKAAAEEAAAKAEMKDFAPERVPFAFGDFSWMPGNYGASERPFAYGPFTGEFRLDAAYHFSFNRPEDNTISGSSEVFRHNELQITQLGIGGDLYYKGVHGRLMTQFGMYSQTTPRNDPSADRGQWNLDDAYRYISEAYGGYHIDALHGINLQAGIFMSYIGLWSYYNFDNWTYQPSYVSSNTPWFFNGGRIQIFVDEHLKIEPWIVNGWQAYGKFNQAPGGGFQLAWRPNDWLSIVGNQYIGTDTLGQADRFRVHTDDSIMARFYEDTRGALSKAAGSLTVDAGCEWGGDAAAGLDVSCQDQFFIGFMAYVRFWFLEDQLGLTAGGGAIRNPGRYLVLVPPINGATGFSGAAPHYTANPGDPYDAWDAQLTADYMPTSFTTFRLELNHRAASIPYFSGRGGVTPPGGNQGAPGSEVEGFAPDLEKDEQRLTGAFMVKL